MGRHGAFKAKVMTAEAKGLALQPQEALFIAGVGGMTGTAFSVPNHRMTGFCGKSGPLLPMTGVAGIRLPYGWKPLTVLLWPIMTVRTGPFSDRRVDIILQKRGIVGRMHVMTVRAPVPDREATMFSPEFTSGEIMTGGTERVFFKGEQPGEITAMHPMTASTALRQGRMAKFAGKCVGCVAGQAQGPLPVFQQFFLRGGVGGMAGFTLSSGNRRVLNGKSRSGRIHSLMTAETKLGDIPFEINTADQTMVAMTASAVPIGHRLMPVSR